MTNFDKIWKVQMAAHSVLDADIDPDDSYKVEQLLRSERGKFPRASKRFVAQVIEDSCNQRDRKRMHSLFEWLDKEVEAWPEGTKKLSDDIKEMRIEDVAGQLERLASEQGDHDWRLDGAVETKAARYAALLMMEQIAWKHYQIQINQQDENVDPETGLIIE